MIIKVIYEFYNPEIGTMRDIKKFSSLKDFGYWCMYKAKIDNDNIMLVDVEYYE